MPSPTRRFQLLGFAPTPPPRRRSGSRGPSVDGSRGHVTCGASTASARVSSSTSLRSMGGLLRRRQKITDRSQIKRVIYFALVWSGDLFDSKRHSLIYSYFTFFVLVHPISICNYLCSVVQLLGYGSPLGPIGMTQRSRATHLNGTYVDAVYVGAVCQSSRWCKCGCASLS